MLKVLTLIFVLITSWAVLSGCVVEPIGSYERPHYHRY